MRLGISRRNAYATRGYLDSHLKYGLVDGAAHGQIMTIRSRAQAG
jgi:hypothetical protein